MPDTQKNLRTISVQELNSLCDTSSVDLLDVRTPVEFRTVRSVYARNQPLDGLDPHQVMRGRDADHPLYVMCRSGNRSTKACEAFLAAGYDNIVNVDGGLMAWEAAGLPVERTKGVISLERQVRIAAGLLTLLGSLLGFFVHPYWIGLPAFIGAGLMFAGITDTCGMGMMLAKMPWNRTAAKTCSAENQECSV